MILDLKDIIKNIKKIKTKTNFTTLEPYLTESSSVSAHNYCLPNNLGFLNNVVKEIDNLEKEISRDLITQRNLPEGIVGQSFFHIILARFRDDERMLSHIFLNRSALHLANRYYQSFERLPTVSSIDDVDYIW